MRCAWIGGCSDGLDRPVASRRHPPSSFVLRRDATLARVRQVRARAWVLCAAALTSIGGAAIAACSTFSGDSGLPAGPDGGIEATAEMSDAEPAADGATVGEASAADADVDAGRVARFSLGCGATTCTVAGDGCCWESAMTGPAGYACARAEDICPVSGDRRFTCDDDDDCKVLGFPGRICCGTLTSSSNVYSLESTACTTPANCAGPSDVQLCDRSVGDECPAGKPCIDRNSYPEPNGGSLWPISPSLNACAP
jgi:hypothetical protein